MATVEITDQCLVRDLVAMPDKLAQAIVEKMGILASNPEFGKPLTGELAGYRRLTHGQYRILYRYHEQSDTVFVVLIGLRKGTEMDDVYSNARRLLRAGKLQATVEQLRLADQLNRKRLADVQARARKAGGGG
ncbi:MAG TPA: type II toxin-antitoxin system RelE/ParE family toxin [bacterium]|nr:type II toxin-antitoxin system RelE/ParE family toxin [bacterium]